MFHRVCLRLISLRHTRYKTNEQFYEINFTYLSDVVSRRTPNTPPAVCPGRLWKETVTFDLPFSISAGIGYSTFIIFPLKVGFAFHFVYDSLRFHS